MKHLYILIIIIITPFYTLSQLIIIDEADINTTTTLISEYLSPLGKSIGTGLNCGWWHTAKTHKILGFDLSLSLNSVKIPNTDLNFNHHETIINNNNFTSDLTTNITPTILGDTDNATIVYKGSFSTNIEMPEGLNINNMFVPTLNLGIGIIKNTDIVISTKDTGIANRMKSMASVIRMSMAYKKEFGILPGKILMMKV